MITKAEIRDAIRKHEDEIRGLKAAILTNDGSKVARSLEACSVSYDGIADLLEAKWPDSFESDAEEEEEEEEDDEEEAIEVEEED
jgi:hypothetical protein